MHAIMLFISIVEKQRVEEETEENSMLILSSQFFSYHSNFLSPPPPFPFPCVGFSRSINITKNGKQISLLLIWISVTHQIGQFYFSGKLFCVLHSVCWKLSENKNLSIYNFCVNIKQRIAAKPPMMTFFPSKKLFIFCFFEIFEELSWQKISSLKLYK